MRGPLGADADGMAAAPVSEAAGSGANGLPSGLATGLATGLGRLVPWLIATGAVTALVVVLLAAVHPASDTSPTQQAQAAVAQRSLTATAGPAAVKRVFGGIKPYTVQPHMGSSNGKDATCSIYSDGNLDTGARVTWAVTLCVVNRIGGRPADAHRGLPAAR